jgi:hypothetical protein
MAMRLVATIGIYVSGSLIERQPSLWEKLKQGLGGRVDLGTDRMKVELEATAVVDQVRRSLQRLGVDNALSLVIDDTVIYQDTAGKAGDLPDLVIALSEHASVFGRGFRELRFAAEHEEAGLHLVIETRARTEHKADEPAAVVSVGGRLRALEPRPGEAPEAYRARVEPLTKDTVAFETARMQFESFANRLEDALRAAIPEGRVEQLRAEAKLVKATPRTPAERPDEIRDPVHPAYDPFMRYYPSPMGLMLDAMIISSFMHAFHPSPAIFVTNPMGTNLGTTQEVAAQPERLEADPGDPGSGGSDIDHAWSDAGGDDGGPGLDDGGGYDSGGGGFDDGGGFGGFGDD